MNVLGESAIQTEELRLRVDIEGSKKSHTGRDRLI